MCGHLWYLSPESVALSFFDKNVSVTTARRMVAALSTDSGEEFTKQYIIKPNEVDSILNKSIEDYLFRFYETI